LFWNHPAREITEITTGITGTIGTETTGTITIMIMIVRKEKTRNSQHFCRHLSLKNVHQVRTSTGEENRYLYLLAAFLSRKCFLQFQDQNISKEMDTITSSLNSRKVLRK